MYREQVFWRPVYTTIWLSMYQGIPLVFYLEALFRLWCRGGKLRQRMEIFLRCDETPVDVKTWLECADIRVIER